MLGTREGIACRLDSGVVYGFRGGCGIWGTRTDTPDSLQNIKFESRRAEFDDRLNIDMGVDAVYTKRMPSAFHETPTIPLVWHQVDTVVVTGLNI